MNFYYFVMLLQITSLCFLVYIAQEEIIFPDRLAPMFAFIAVKAMIVFSFTAFWALCGTAA